MITIDGTRFNALQAAGIFIIVALLATFMFLLVNFMVILFAVAFLVGFILMWPVVLLDDIIEGYKWTIKKVFNKD